MNELGSKKAEADGLYESNKAWFEQKQAELQELDQLRTRLAATTTATTTTTTPVVDPSKVVTPESLAQTIAETERGAVAFFTDLNALSLQHFQQFGEILDTTKLITDKRVQQIGLRGVYAEVHKAQLDDRAAKQAKAAEDTIRADERTKVLAAQASQHHPYPVRGNEPSSLDGIEAQRTGQAPTTKSVDDLVTEYARLSASRVGSPV
jgi:hypothetical protein